MHTHTRVYFRNLCPCCACIRMWHVHVCIHILVYTLGTCVSIFVPVFERTCTRLHTHTRVYFRNLCPCVCLHTHSRVCFRNFHPTVNLYFCFSLIQGRKHHHQDSLVSNLANVAFRVQFLLFECSGWRSADHSHFSHSGYGGSQLTQLQFHIFNLFVNNKF